MAETEDGGAVRGGRGNPPEAAGGGPEVPAETPEADAAEQRTDLTGDDEPDWEDGEVPLDVDEGDAAEQRRVVRTDEDDYRR